MPDAHALWLFSLATLALLLVPGPAVLYIVAQSVDHGRLAGFVSVAGVHVGTLVHTFAAAVGLSALIVSSAVAFTIVKYAGAAYLVYLGIRRLLERTELPQFVDPSRTVWSQVVVLGFLFVALGFVSDGLYALTAGTLGGWLRRRPGILRWGSGSVYIGLGALTAVTRRS